MEIGLIVRYGKLVPGAGRHRNLVWRRSPRGSRTRV